MINLITVTGSLRFGSRREKVFSGLVGNNQPWNSNGKFMFQGRGGRKSLVGWLEIISLGTVMGSLCFGSRKEKVFSGLVGSN